MKDKLPKISIITPSFNQGQFIEQTILSVLNQNYPNLQYIIVDGGSNDNTIGIINKYRKQISHVIVEKDEGQSDALNKGFQLVDGEIFNWLNSDDYLEPGILKKIADKYTERNFDSIFFDLNIVDENSKVIKKSRGTKIEKNQAKAIGELKPLIQPASFFRKQILNEIFPLRKDLHYSMDFEMWIRINILNKNLNCAYINEIGVNFRIHQQSKTNQNFTTDNPFDENNLFLKEINSVFYSLCSFKDKDSLFWEVPRTDFDFSYSDRIVNGAKDIIVFYVEHLGNQLYASSSKKNIESSRTYFKKLIINGFFNLSIIKSFLLSFFPNLVLNFRNLKQ